MRRAAKKSAATRKAKAEVTDDPTLEAQLTAQESYVLGRLQGWISAYAEGHRMSEHYLTRRVARALLGATSR